MNRAILLILNPVASHTCTFSSLLSINQNVQVCNARKATYYYYSRDHKKQINNYTLDY